MSRDEKRMKKKVKIKTRNEKIVETDRDIWQTYEKQLLESGRNSATEVTARIICNLLLKAQNMPEIQIFLLILWQSSEILQKLSGCLSYTKYL